MEGLPAKTPATEPSRGKRRLFESQAEEIEDDEPLEEDEEGWSDPGVPDELDPHEAYEEEKAWSGKRRRLPLAELDLPGNGDLSEFFGDIEPSQQIAICRAYASYLAAQLRARKPGKPATYAPRWRK